ncbi:gamma-glutamyltransferase [Stappia taiwanensis]|uniref:Gamma-glutamyltransferase n=1 Tax=Stappia taiwanensis TaxID=992267 RepID=A0A838XMJ7_9HYPH|nr:gamma-glutamyltransferase [Stappia taiwanensis]
MAGRAVRRWPDPGPPRLGAVEQERPIVSSSNFSKTQSVRKSVLRTRHGVVAAQHRRAAEVGAEVLAAGGDAVDAAVAVSFAIGVVEPWMSGPGGGGAMMLWRQDEGRAYAVNYGMRAPKALDPADYPLEENGTAGDLFPWKAVTGNRNVEGATAIAVPGTVEGAGQVHERFGKLPWADLLQPAVGLANEGLLVDWYAALIIASATRSLARDPDAAAQYLEDGQWPTIAGWTALATKRIDMSGMAATLDRLATAGYRDFYDGDIAAMLVKDVQAKGSSLGRDDLAAYRAVIEAPLKLAYRDAHIHALPGLTAGPTLAEVLASLQAELAPGDQPDGAAFAAYARALKGAYRSRLAGMGDGEAPSAPGCTTHFSIVDRHGNMVAMTQTLLSIFGSRVVSPSTGLMMNNGIMWFDPEPGKPNSLGAGKRCLMNVCPVIGEKGARRFALGASGGRKIVSAVSQLSSFLTDFDMSLEEAFHAPRIDVSGGETVIADETLPGAVIEALAADQPVTTTKRTTFPYAFACPTAVLREGGENMGATEIMSPWGDAALEREES